MIPAVRLVLRGTALASCAGLVAGGFALALRNGGDAVRIAGPSSTVDVVFVPAAPTSRPETRGPQATSPSPQPGRGVAETTPAANTPQANIPAPLAPVTMVAAAPPSLPTAAPRIEDLPRYRDIEVLGFAANAVLPSGLTFRECIDLPPREEGWPFAVHLYYLGGGDWMVETHLSEVQVVFHEAANSFEVRNFQPVNPACR